MKKIRFVMMLAALLVVSGAWPRLQPLTNREPIPISRCCDRMSRRKRLMSLAQPCSSTDTDAKAFWPLYREYANKQQTLGDERVSVIKDYAASTTP